MGASAPIFIARNEGIPVEYSAIQAIDFALGRLLVDVYDHQQMNGPANWQAFLKRPTSQRIKRGDFDTVTDILKAVESTEQGSSASTNGKVKANQVQLPLIVYGRKTPIVVSEPDAGAYQIGQHATGPSGADLKLSLAQVSVDYRIAMMAWDRPALDTLQLAWLFHVAVPGQHRLSYEVQIGGETLTITGELVDPRTPMFEDASLERSEGRVHAVILTVTVKTYAVMGASVVVPPALQWILASPMDQVYGAGSADPDGIPPGSSTATTDPNDPNNAATHSREPGGAQIVVGYEDGQSAIVGIGSLDGDCDGGICWPNKV